MVSWTLLFSASARAVPLLQADVAGTAAENTYFAKHKNSSTSRSEADKALFPTNSFLWNGSVNKINLPGNPSGLNLLYGLHSLFAAPLPGSDPASFIILDLSMAEVAEINNGIGSTEDENAMSVFLLLWALALRTGDKLKIIQGELLINNTRIRLTMPLR